MEDIQKIVDAVVGLVAAQPKEEVEVPEVEILVITPEDLIEEYFDEKRVLISDKIGNVVDSWIGGDEGDIIRMYVGMGEMLRPTLALMCYDASGGAGEDAEDVAALIELAYNVVTNSNEILTHDYAKDINNSIQDILGTPGAAMRGDFGFVGGIIDAMRDGPKLIADGVNAAKVAMGSTVAEVARGDYTSDSAYITSIKTGMALSLSISCKLGAEKSGHEECIELCGIYGRALGNSYIIGRDIRLLEAAENDEAIQERIKDGALNLCMMYALDRCGANALVVTDDAKWLYRELQKEDLYDDGILRLQIAERKYSRLAVRAAKRLPPSPYRDMLIAMPTYLKSWE